MKHGPNILDYAAEKKPPPKRPWWQILAIWVAGLMPMVLLPFAGKASGETLLSIMFLTCAGSSLMLGLLNANPDTGNAFALGIYVALAWWLTGMDQPISAITLPLLTFLPFWLLMKLGRFIRRLFIRARGKS